MSIEYKAAEFEALYFDYWVLAYKPGNQSPMTFGPFKKRENAEECLARICIRTDIWCAKIGIEARATP